ncbi:MAG: prepilin-type N-terminal cleavage/methylation domain-containing protein [Xanthomonadales bacterium]|nr:prepilin-type N-terminal cleavage/methylation domain-containing protein [Xanthomonadales bacterium]
MTTISKKQIKSSKRQQGMTLIELLVAGVISLIAASGMVIVMANTLGTGSKTIQMAKVTQEMRTAMQIMSRELRRANYHSTYMSCFRDVDCLATLGISTQVGEINITDNGDSDCFWFWYDRPQTGTAIAVTSEPVAAFRRTVVSGVGRIQMTTTRTAAPGCNANADWVDITDPELIDVLTFNVNDTGSFVETINAGGDTQSVERIGLTITARLTPDPSLPAWLQGNTNANRELREFVTVRNHTYN